MSYNDYPAIRRAGADDVPFLIDLARDVYATRAGTIPGLTEEGAIGWLRWAIANPDRLVLCGPHSGGVASVSFHYGYERRARVDVLAARPTPGAALEAMRMVRVMLAWAREHGASRLRLGADTGVDFGPFARRLGGERKTEVYYDFSLQETGHGQ
jgi:hypothetical protein